MRCVRSSRKEKLAMPTDPSHQPETETVEERLLAFIHGELLSPGLSVGPDDDLLSELLDSVAALRLATFVADEFEIEIQPADYVIENFQTAAALARYVRQATAR